MNLASRYVELSRLGRTAFTEAVPSAVLVVHSPVSAQRRMARGTAPQPPQAASTDPRTPAPQEVLDDPLIEESLLPTDKFRITAEAFAEPFAPLGDERSAKKDELTFLPLKKKKGTPFVDLITLGRTFNNDLCLAETSVSRFHAFFRRRDEGWFVCDAGSTNGSYLDGERLEARSEHLLRNGSRLRFGNCELRFHSPTSLYDFLQDRRR